MSGKMTLGELFSRGRQELARAEVPEAEASAWYLLQACFREEGMELTRSDYYLRRDEEAPVLCRERYRVFLEKRCRRIPLEYIIGHTEFMGLLFRVDENVLVPRQDTETLVELLYPMCDGKRVLDLCTGSGCIGLSIGALGKPSGLVLSDISSGALRVAQENLAALQREGSFDVEIPVQFVCCNLFEGIDGVYDVIASNPPYIETGQIAGLMPEVGKYEPFSALDGGRDGLDFYRRIIHAAPDFLEEEGILCLEIGYDQGKRVSGLMRKRGFADIRIERDLAGKDRVVTGRKSYT